MLVLREAQLRALAVAALGERLLDDLPARHAAAAALPRAELRARVEAALARARGHGLADERDLVAFVRLDLLLGPTFDAAPRLAALLADRSRPPDERLAAVLAALTPRRPA